MIFIPRARIKHCEGRLFSRPLRLLWFCSNTVSATQVSTEKAALSTIAKDGFLLPCRNRLLQIYFKFSKNLVEVAYSATVIWGVWNERWNGLESEERRYVGRRAYIYLTFTFFRIHWVLRKLFRPAKLTLQVAEPIGMILSGYVHCLTHPGVCMS